MDFDELFSAAVEDGRIDENEAEKIRIAYANLVAESATIVEGKLKKHGHSLDPLPPSIASMIEKQRRARLVHKPYQYPSKKYDQDRLPPPRPSPNVVSAITANEKTRIPMSFEMRRNIIFAAIVFPALLFFILALSGAI